MTQEELKMEFDRNKDLFDIIKKEIDSTVVKIENFKGVFYEIFPFCYQRGGFKQGKPIVNPNLIKSTNELYIYGFNNQGNIAVIQEGISLENEFYYQFLFYEKECFKSLSYDNRKDLQSISICFKDDKGRIVTIYHKGRRGGRKEEYEYNKDGILERILIRQFDGNGNEADTLIHSFDYETNGKLKSIRKSTINNSSYSEIIYPPH